MAPVFYQPLAQSGRGIRVLTLKPGSRDAVIECEMWDATLDDTIHYEALSYTWGDNASPRRMLLNGLEHLITANLEAALRHLRREDHPRTLWIDQLCINQEDVQERAAQVKLMAEIYKRATVTVSWLGEASEDSDEAMDLMCSLGTWIVEHQDTLFEDEHDDLPDDGSIETTTDFIEWLGFPLRSQNWSAMCKLLERPYWTRVWIVQELAVRGPLLKASGIICCGKKEVQRSQYDHVCALILYIVLAGNNVRAVGQQVDEPVRSILNHGHPPGLTMAQTLAGCTNQKAANRSLCSLLLISIKFQATDPRDKFYALLGLASDGEQCFKPDYTKTYAAVLRDFVKFDVEHHNSLRALLFSRFRIHPTEPSWTPDLFAKQHAEGSRLHPMVIGHFRAAGSTEPVVAFDDASPLMKAKGVLVGKIDSIIGPLQIVEKYPGPTTDFTAHAVSIGQLKTFEALRDFDMALPTAAARESFWRTLCMDCNWTDDDMKQEFPAPGELEQQKSVMLGERPLPQDFMPGFPEAMRSTNFTQPFLRAVQKALGGHTFFTTTDGRMGLGPYHTQVGDVAAVLFGCTFCIVLRPFGQQYQLVGGAYVHGAMQGELVEGSVEHGGLQTFELC